MDREQLFWQLLIERTKMGPMSPAVLHTCWTQSGELFAQFKQLKGAEQKQLEELRAAEAKKPK